jgi:hypothetical protein
MKSLIIILLVFYNVVASVGQNLKIFKGEVETAFTLNGKTYLVKNGGKKTSELKNGVYHSENYHILFRDTIVIDTLDFGIYASYHSLSSDSIYFIEVNDKILVFDHNKERFEYTGVNIENTLILGLIDNQLLSYEFKTHFKKQYYFLNTEVIFNKINPLTGEKTKIYSFNNLFEEDDMIIKSEYYPFKKKLRLFTGLDPGQGAGYSLPYKVFFVDLNNKLSEESTFISSFEDKNLHYDKGYYIGDSYFFDIQKRYIFISYYKEIDEPEREFLTINSDLKKIDTPFLPKVHDVKGVVYLDDRLDAYWLSSELDTKIASWSNKYKKAVITYSPDIRIEAALFRAYHNALLDKESVKVMVHEHLLVLKNMVFAKYNYDFNNEYYQAFFNLFGFYNTDEMRKNRIKDVNDKLTTVDKENLALINKALKKFEN